jgi:hypothetical protein
LRMRFDVRPKADLARRGYVLPAGEKRWWDNVVVSLRLHVGYLPQMQTVREHTT